MFLSSFYAISLNNYGRRMILLQRGFLLCNGIGLFVGLQTVYKTIACRIEKFTLEVN